MKNNQYENENIENIEQQADEQIEVEASEKTVEEKSGEAKKEADLKKEKKLTETEKLNAEKEEALAQAAEYKDKWVRSVAEFDNYKKRNAKLWQDAYSEGAADVILKILSVGDNLDYALNMSLDEKTMEGLKSIKKQFDDTLKTLNVVEINPIGKLFDPNEAEAVMQAAKEEGEESDRVKQVFLKGYKLNDKIIRYAKVSVIK